MVFRQEKLGRLASYSLGIDTILLSANLLFFFADQLTRFIYLPNYEAAYK